MENACESENLMKTQEQSGERNKENRRTEASDSSHYFGKESDEEKQEWKHECLIAVAIDRS
jgi:hypothetical protein